MSDWDRLQAAYQAEEILEAAMMSETRNYWIIENSDGDVVISNSQTIDDTISGPYPTIEEAQKALRARRWRPLAWAIYILGLLLVLVAIGK